MTFSLLNIFTIDSLDPNESIIDFYANPLSTFLPFDNSLEIGASAPETNMHMFSNVVHSEYWRPSPLLDTVLQRFMHQIILILIIMSAIDKLLTK